MKEVISLKGSKNLVYLIHHCNIDDLQGKVDTINIQGDGNPIESRFYCPDCKVSVQSSIIIPAIPDKRLKDFPIDNILITRMGG